MANEFCRISALGSCSISFSLKRKKKKKELKKRSLYPDKNFLEWVLPCRVSSGPQCLNSPQSVSKLSTMLLKIHSTFLYQYANICIVFVLYDQKPGTKLYNFIWLMMSLQNFNCSVSLSYILKKISNSSMILQHCNKLKHSCTSSCSQFCFSFFVFFLLCEFSFISLKQMVFSSFMWMQQTANANLFTVLTLENIKTAISEKQKHYAKELGLVLFWLQN